MKNATTAQLITLVTVLHLAAVIVFYSKQKIKSASGAYNVIDYIEVSDEGILKAPKTYEVINHIEGSDEIILTAPFRIVQIGPPRTGSTFQFQLLDAIVSLKSPDDVEIETVFVRPREWDVEEIRGKIANNTSFVIKTHFEHRSLKRLQKRGDIAVFASSTDVAPYAVYNQDRKRLEECTLCEIDRYQPLFGLTNEEVKSLKLHMDLYSSLRQCCGEQMSKYETLRLNGCDVSMYMDRSDYPKCEDKDLEKIELQFAASPIPFKPNNPEINWSKPGDCDRFNKVIASGRGFNGRDVSSCEIDGKFAGKKEYKKKRKLETVPPSDSEDTSEDTAVLTSVTSAIKRKTNRLMAPPWLSKYIQFHRSSIEEGRIKEGIRYVVYECTGEELCGGIGDRVIGMVKALYFAMCTDRVLLINAPYPVPLETILNPNLMEWNASFSENTTAIFDDMAYGKRISSRLDLVGYRLGRTNGHHSYRLSDILKSEAMRLHFESNGWSKFFDSESMFVARAFHDAFWALFNFDQNVLLRAEEMKLGSGLPQSNLPGNEVLPYVGLHHRGGDRTMFTVKKGVKAPRMSSRFVKSKETLSCYNTVKYLLFPRDGVVPAAAYVASDNADSKKMMREMDSTIHFHDEMQIFHIDWSVREGTVKKDKHNTDSIQQGVIDMMAEIVVLVDSHCLIMSKSMFSFLAYYIRGPDDQCNVSTSQCNEIDLLRRSNLFAYESGDKISPELSDKTLRKRFFKARGKLRKKKHYFWK
mmetsp:Transcript_15754/g.35453  ORF Transcript_15754/g.35453 Transcript_15754/m.35453 type:complete len:752 (-) Transcript_15754:371-2626(-)